MLQQNLIGPPDAVIRKLALHGSGPNTGQLTAFPCLRHTICIQVSKNRACNASTHLLLILTKSQVKTEQIGQNSPV